MTKKVNYFSHDYSARNDAKIISLRRKTWMEWLGIFWALVEMLYENGGELSADDENLENLAYEWRCEVEKIKIVIFECWLFVVENWKFFSNSVNERLKKINSISEKAKKSAEKRWGKNDEKNADDMRTHTKNDATAQENDANALPTQCEIEKIDATAMQIKKEINKKIKKEINAENPTLADTPDGGETEIATSEVSETLPVFSFDFFLKNFPKQTKIFEAQNAFLLLTNDERNSLAKVFPFWLNYWKTINPCYVPNPFDFLKNRRFLEKIPEKNGNFVAEKPQKIKPQTSGFPDVDEQEITKQRAERAKILKFFHENLDEKIRAEIEEQADQKYANTMTKKWSLLYEIEIARLTRPYFTA